MLPQTRLELHHLNRLTKHGQNREFWHEFGVLCDNWEDEERPGWEWVRRIHQGRLWPWRRAGFGWCLGVVTNLLDKFGYCLCNSWHDSEAVFRTWSSAIRVILERAEEAEWNQKNLTGVLELRYTDPTMRARTVLGTGRVLMKLYARYDQLGKKVEAERIRFLLNTKTARPIMRTVGWGYRDNDMVCATWADAIHWAIERAEESPA